MDLRSITVDWSLGLGDMISSGSYRNPPKPEGLQRFFPHVISPRSGFVRYYIYLASLSDEDPLPRLNHLYASYWKPENLWATASAVHLLALGVQHPHIQLERVIVSDDVIIEDRLGPLILGLYSHIDSRMIGPVRRRLDMRYQQLLIARTED